MYIFFIVLILITSLLLVLGVLAQNPKGGMAANFGVSNQVMGVRQTTDFLEKFTWTLAIAIVVLSLAATMAMPRGSGGSSNDAMDRAAEQQAAPAGGLIPNQTALPVEGEVPAAGEAAADETAE